MVMGRDDCILAKTAIGKYEDRGCGGGPITPPVEERPISERGAWGPDFRSVWVEKRSLSDRLFVLGERKVGRPRAQTAAYCRSRPAP